MALLDWITPDPTLRLKGDGIVLRAPRQADYAAWSALRLRSRDFLQPWEPAWPEDDLTRAAYKRRLGIYAREIEIGGAYPFFILREEDQALVGGVTLSNIRRGVAEVGTLGYWVGQPYLRRGHASAAVRLVCRFAFDRLNLHRIEAACLPTNTGSQRVLLGSGFELEGKARAYLKINGEWRDHLLFGRVREGG